MICEQYFHQTRSKLHLCTLVWVICHDELLVLINWRNNPDSIQSPDQKTNTNWQYKARNRFQKIFTPNQSILNVFILKISNIKSFFYLKIYCLLLSHVRNTFYNIWKRVLKRLFYVNNLSRSLWLSDVGYFEPQDDSLF